MGFKTDGKVTVPDNPQFGVLLGCGFKPSCKDLFFLTYQKWELKIDLPSYLQPMKFLAFYHKNSDSENYFLIISRLVQWLPNTFM